ncbi:sulfotransferase [Sphingomonas sp. LY54]|uniref:sulfotransferase family protein n=1 Tax=Sphingomonas sp. LY54 TaxID=3095343 RepID=UPI002D776647|nr:sulfotransferase [Sphingomonas sp. LY54]WRP28206.1 sulfotransferase [Sphingomonas sp. LY54]
MEPIFIIGCQRSGTTMLGSLLGAARGVIAIPEAQFVADLAPSDPQGREKLADILARIERHYRFRIWNHDLGSERPAGEGTHADAVRWLVAHYAGAQGRTGITHWIDHQPGHVREMERLAAHFPGLRAVHVVRDGRAVAASILPLDWGPNQIHSAANFWAQRVAMGLALRHYLGEGRWHQVRYEDLVTDPHRELSRICDFLGLQYDPAMADGQGFAVPRFTRGQHALVGQRPDPTRLDGWRKVLMPRQVEIFEALVGPLLTYLGYRRDYDRARLPSIPEKLRLTAADQWLALANRRTFRKRVAEHGAYATEVPR